LNKLCTERKKFSILELPWYRYEACTQLAQFHGKALITQNTGSSSQLGEQRRSFILNKFIVQVGARMQIFVHALIDLLGWNTAALTALRENKTKPNTN